MSSENNRVTAVKISDGLGNQLFQYACACSVWKRNGGRLILDHSIVDTNPMRHYELDRFQLKADEVIGVNHIPTKAGKVLVRMFLQKVKFSSLQEIREKEPYGFDESIFTRKESVYLNGYWQNYRYFHDFRNEISNMLEPSFPMSDYACEMRRKIIETPDSVSVHIRRGDYVGKADLPLSYYHEAIAALRSRLSHPVFYMFSDDISYIREQFGDREDMRMIENHSKEQSSEDFILMKSCSNHIIANSSYSWWAAYASAEGITVCPVYRVWTDSFYPSEWIRIQVDDLSE